MNANLASTSWQALLQKRKILYAAAQEMMPK